AGPHPPAPSPLAGGGRDPLEGEPSKTPEAGGPGGGSAPWKRAQRPWSIRTPWKRATRPGSSSVRLVAIIRVLFRRKACPGGYVDQCGPITSNLLLALGKVELAGADLPMDIRLDHVLLMEARRRAGRLGPQVRRLIRATVLERNQVIDFVLARLMS